jgi:beta-glucosidase/6-phospho-beta-glucosidase/beta-galactosidase
MTSIKKFKEVIWLESLFLKSSIIFFSSGRVGLTLGANYCAPLSNSPEDKEAADKQIQFYLGWFAHPIFSTTGDYPMIMKKIIAKKSEKQGFRRSRLPQFTPEEIDMIKVSSDYFGVNHYTTYFVTNRNGTDDTPSFLNDIGVDSIQDPAWPSSASPWLKVVPWGFRKILNWIKDSYGNVETIVFECGYSDNGKMQDVERIDFLRDYMRNMLDAIEDGCNITAFSVWSLMDDMEWNKGYT